MGLLPLDLDSDWNLDHCLSWVSSLLTADLRLSVSKTAQVNHYSKYKYKHIVQVFFSEEPRLTMAALGNQYKIELSAQNKGPDLTHKDIIKYKWLNTLVNWQR